MRLFLFAFIIATVIVSSQFLAAQGMRPPQVNLTPEQMVWVRCADKVAAEWQIESRDPDRAIELQAEICTFIGAEDNETCDKRMMELARFGVLEVELTRYIMENVLVPACGQPPR